MGTLFGLAVALVITVSFLSPSVVLQKLSLLFLLAWSTTNVAVWGAGFVHAPLVIPSIDAVVAVMVAVVGYHSRSRVARAVFILYGLVVAFHVGSFITHTQGQYVYYAALNLLFLTQLLIVGTTGAWLAVRHWPIARGQRLRPDPSRR